MIRPLFVYGTLMRDGDRADLLRGCRRRPARVRGALWSLPAGYPALVAGEGEVYGELVEPVSEGLLALLDTYEGVSEGLFRRDLVEVRVDTERVQAWCYRMVDPRRHGGHVIESGRWRPTRHR